MSGKDDTMFEEISDAWELVVGLEVHTELKTTTKLFCGCSNQFGSEPNTNICPVCLGLPGSLPVLNRHAVELSIRVGLALNCTVQASLFHRKNYFYPDMPKDYQISQYDLPLNIRGHLVLPSGHRVGIERAHMEEDTGKSSHLGGSGRISSASASLIDYNRSGVPLVEIVSAPDIHTPEQAREYVSELRSVLVAVGASDGKMEEGSLRVDANVSVRPRGSTELRTRCEIKNLNSLRSLGRAIAHEANRHIALYESGESPTQQTRFWDESGQVTGALRTKEEANDYRYFPEPDLVPLAPSQEWIQSIRDTLPELPQQRREWVMDLCGEATTNDRIETAISDELYPFLVATLRSGLSPQRVVARTSNELAAELPLPNYFSTERFVEICSLEERGELTPTQVKTLLTEATHDDAPISELIARLGLVAISADSLAEIVNSVIEESPAEWTRFVEGEQQLRGFLVGKIMKASKGKADGKVVGEMLVERVSAAKKVG